MMVDINKLLDAWDLIDKLNGEQGNKKDTLYDIYYQISTAILKYRLKHNLSQTNLAEKLGVTQAMVSKLESGDYNYTIEQLWKVSQKLGFKLNVEFAEVAETMAEEYLQKKAHGVDAIPPQMAVG
jgi:ribosome-binding protein aMBF1 (putative translation factor)